MLLTKNKTPGQVLEYSEETNLLEQSEYRFNLQERATPNLYRHLFDYENVPKVAFNHRYVPINMPDEIWMTDTTFRDGQQSTSPFTVEQIVELYKLLHKLGGPKGLVRQSEFFVYTEKDRRALQECMALGYEFPEVTTWIRANEKDFDLVKQFGVKETGILVSCSDYHIYNKMGLTRAKAMDKYLGIVKSVLDKGIRPRCHFEDITRADYYGFVVPFAEALQRLSNESGIPIKIRACDTMGFGVSYPGAALPRSVPGIIYGLQHYAGVPSSMIEWHGHNDFYKVVSNASTAWLYGCSSINCSMLGIGERTGNCPIEAMAMEYASLRGTTDGMDLTAITDIARYFEDVIGYEIPPRTPFVGRNFNVTRAGIHADGLLKDEEIYNIFDTQKILGRPAAVAVDSHSGLAGIAHWMNGFYRLNGTPAAIDKKHPAIAKIKEMVDAEYEGGRTTVMGDTELEDMFKKADPITYKMINHYHSK
ncbi:MAG: 2-isopropylmalate synthase [Ruminococcaceae bacterium]|nr:2-isopropylmalate synthase [Oscillospiraceae bacterium]MBQ9691931.1 2-isopropylmalate synthase [Clostridia bacterium]